MLPEKRMNILGGLLAVGIAMMAAAFLPGRGYPYSPTTFKAGALVSLCSYVCLRWVAGKNGKNDKNDDTNTGDNDD